MCCLHVPMFVFRFVFSSRLRGDSTIMRRYGHQGCGRIAFLFVRYSGRYFYISAQNYTLHAESFRSSVTMYRHFLRARYAELPRFPYFVLYNSTELR